MWWLCLSLRAGRKTQITIWLPSFLPNNRPACLLGPKLLQKTAQIVARTRASERSRFPVRLRDQHLLVAFAWGCHPSEPYENACNTRNKHGATCSGARRAGTRSTQAAVTDIPGRGYVLPPLSLSRSLGKTRWFKQPGTVPAGTFAEGRTRAFGTSRNNATSASIGQGRARAHVCCRRSSRKVRSPRRPPSRLPGGSGAGPQAESASPPRGGSDGRPLTCLLGSPAVSLTEREGSQRAPCGDGTRASPVTGTPPSS